VYEEHLGNNLMLGELFLLDVIGEPEIQIMHD
jgi:hypothetical protein